MNRVVTFASHGLIAAGLAIMPVAAFAQSAAPSGGGSPPPPAAAAASQAPGGKTAVPVPAPAQGGKVVRPTGGTHQETAKGPAKGTTTGAAVTAGTKPPAVAAPKTGG